MHLVLVTIQSFIGSIHIFDEVMSGRPRKVIYIMGLSHSGSTVLDMLLTTGGKAVGLGQVWTVLREAPEAARERACSCGAQAKTCAFWGPVLERLATCPNGASPTERYRVVLEGVDRLYGPDIAVIDSSKHAEYLDVVANQFPALDLTILHNIKDVRPFTISTLDNLQRKSNRRDLPEKIFYQWYRDNRTSYARALRVVRRPPVRVMYEGLCLATDAVVERLAEALGNNFIDLAGSLHCGHTHIIAGNRLRLPQNDKIKRLSYDSRWLARTEWLRPYLLMPMVRRYNETCLRECAHVI